MKLSSPAFQHGAVIPSLYTCEGKGINPPLEISGVPEKTRALVLIMDDPDVPRDRYPTGVFDHWVVIDIPPSCQKIAAHAKPPGIEGKNSSGFNGYIGPCPPDREHRYFFKLYALTKQLHLPADCTKSDVEKAMEGHILASCQLMGRYEKGQGY